MAITVSGTQITFNDATVQTTAFTGGAGQGVVVVKHLLHQEHLLFLQELMHLK